MKIAIAIGALLAGLTLAACEAPTEEPSAPAESSHSSEPSESSDSPSIEIGGSGTPIINNDGGTVTRPDGTGIEVGGGWHLTPDGELDFGF